MNEPTFGFCLYTRHPEYFYRLKQSAAFATPFRPEKDLVGEFGVLKTDGTAILNAGYGWNGPSGIPKKLHTDGMIYGALIHDFLYGLMCEGILSRSKASRKMADEVLRKVMKSAGSWLVTSWTFYFAVQVKGRDYAKPSALDPYRVEMRAP